MFDFSGFKLKVELVHPNAKPMTRANEGDAGMDFYACESCIIKPGQAMVVPVGVRVEMLYNDKPTNDFVMIFKEKSGVATKKKCAVGAGVIDAGYRGLLGAYVKNESDDDVIFDIGEKVAQAIIVPVWTGQPIVVDKVNMDTERGESGFGSSGAF